MGAAFIYLEKPNTNVEFQEGDDKQVGIRYVAAEMQGWRLNMVRRFALFYQEDAHISNLNFNKD